MSAPAGLFCAHKRLRTSCPECRPPPPPPSPPKAKAPKPQKAAATSSGDADEADEKKGPTAMLPRKSKPKRVNDRAEAESAVAWWVKRK